MPEEFVVVCNQQALPITPAGLKTPTPSGENEIIPPIKTATVVVVNAETAAAAINGVKALFPGRVTQACFAAKKSGWEEK